MRSGKDNIVQACPLAALAALLPITLGGAAARAENFTVLHSFTDISDGANPSAGLINVGGTLYGTTVDGGLGNWGTVFKITPAGVETVLYSFGYVPNGYGPGGDLINVGGVLYGTTGGGGTQNCGTVFKLTPAGAASILHSFKCAPADGQDPGAGLINVGGTLYGTTGFGGTNNEGTVFKVTQAGVETVLHAFGASADGKHPAAALINVGGTLYGTTYDGGTNNFGTVFTISPAGVESVLYSFQGGTDASLPLAPLLNVGGTLYGTGSRGGSFCRIKSYSCGAVFTITLQGHETVLHTFQGKPDGAYPEAGLIYSGGNLYGTTAWGGNGGNCNRHGCGTIFKLTPAGVETIVHSFSHQDGIYPESSLLKLGQFLYGTTNEYGGSYFGTVFAVKVH